MVGRLAVYGPQPAINIPGFLFASGISATSAQIEHASEIFNQPGYCFTGFRDWPNCLSGPNFDIREHDRVVMVRDPRDMLVSSYFSMAHSHPVPRSGETRQHVQEVRERALVQTVDEYVLGESRDFYRDNLDRLSKVWSNPLMPVPPKERIRRRDNHRRRVLLFRYEDVVFKKAQMAHQICEFFGWEIDPAIIVATAGEFDVFPGEENPRRHIRQVTPGDFKRKLKAETIMELNSTFAPYLRLFDYPE